jgi:hypothetical protein
LGLEPLRHQRRDVYVHLTSFTLPAGSRASCSSAALTMRQARTRPPAGGDDRDRGRPRDLAEGGVAGVGDPRQGLMALAATGRPAAVTAPDQPAYDGFIIRASASVGGLAADRQRCRGGADRPGWPSHRGGDTIAW